MSRFTTPWLIAAVAAVALSALAVGCGDSPPSGAASGTSTVSARSAAPSHSCPPNCALKDLRGSSFWSAHGKDYANVDFEGADLRGTVLKGGYNFSGALLSRALMDDVVWHTVDLDGADLSGATMVKGQFGKGTAEDANMTGADLRNSDWSGVDFTGADLSGADTRGWNASMAIFSGTICPDGQVKAPC